MRILRREVAMPQELECACRTSPMVRRHSEEDVHVTPTRGIATLATAALSALILSGCGGSSYANGYLYYSQSNESAILIYPFHNGSTNIYAFQAGSTTRYPVKLSINGNSVTMTANGSSFLASVITGSLNSNDLDLTVPNHDGSLGTDVFAPGTTNAFNRDVAQLSASGSASGACTPGGTVYFTFNQIASGYTLQSLSAEVNGNTVVTNTVNQAVTNASNPNLYSSTSNGFFGISPDGQTILFQFPNGDNGQFVVFNFRFADGQGNTIDVSTSGCDVSQ